VRYKQNESNGFEDRITQDQSAQMLLLPAFFAWQSF
jgi:hypothetical protein